MCRIYCRYQIAKAEIRRQQAEISLRQKLLGEGTKQDPDIKEVWLLLLLYGKLSVQFVSLRNFEIVHVYVINFVPEPDPNLNSMCACLQISQRNVKIAQMDTFREQDWYLVDLSSKLH